MNVHLQGKVSHPAYLPAWCGPPSPPPTPRALNPTLCPVPQIGCHPSSLQALMHPAPAHASMQGKQALCSLPELERAPTHPSSPHPDGQLPPLPHWSPLCSQLPVRASCPAPCASFLPCAWAMPGSLRPRPQQLRPLCVPMRRSSSVLHNICTSVCNYIVDGVALAKVHLPGDPGCVPSAQHAGGSQQRCEGGSGNASPGPPIPATTPGWPCMPTPAHSPVLGVGTLDVLTLLEVRLQVHLEEGRAAGVVWTPHRPVLTAALVVPGGGGPGLSPQLHRLEVGAGGSLTSAH